jgi:hypothetical protein
MKRKKVESKEGQNLPLFLPKKAIRRKDKNGRFYYINEKGKRVKKEIWKSVKKAEKQKRAKKEFKQQNEYKSGLNFEFFFTQGTGEIKEYLFEHNYKIKIGSEFISQLGSSDLFIFLKETYQFLEDEFDKENEIEGEYPMIYITLQFLNEKGILEIIQFFEGNLGIEYTADELWQDFKK